MTDKKQILIVFGTRPETIKVAPIIKRLLKSPTLHPVVCNTGQHRELTAQAQNPYGDGDAAEKIIKHLNAFFTPTQRTQEWTSIPHAQ